MTCQPEGCSHWAVVINEDVHRWGGSLPNPIDWVEHEPVLVRKGRHGFLFVDISARTTGASAVSLC